MRGAFLAFMILMILSGCTGKGLALLDRGVLEEGGEIGKDIVGGLKKLGEDAVTTSWSETKVMIPANDSWTLHNDVIYNRSVKKHVICEIKSNTPISMYIIPNEEYSNLIAGNYFKRYYACSGENVLEYKCGESCIIPQDSLVHIINSGSSDVEVEIDIKYKILDQ